MSRSYKKYTVIRQEKEDYRYLNRQIRHDRFAKFPTPGAFKRHRPHWHSWHCLWSKEDAIKEWYGKIYATSSFDSLEEWLNYWARCALRK